MCVCVRCVCVVCVVFVCVLCVCVSVCVCASKSVSKTHDQQIMIRKEMRNLSVANLLEF